MQTIPGDILCQQKSLVTLVICYKFQKNLFEVFFSHDFIHVDSPGAGADNPLGTLFWCQQEILVTSFICCKFQKNLFEVWFYTIFSWFYTVMYIAPGQGQTAPRGQRFDVSFICCKFQKYVFEVWFYTFFHDLVHVYSPGAGDKILMSTERPYNYPFVASFKEISLKSDFYTNFSLHVYSPGAYSSQGTKFWCQQKLLVTLVICC